MGFLCLPDPLEISVGVRKSLRCSAFWWIWLGVLLDVRIVGAFLVWQRNFDKTTSSRSTSKVSGTKDRPTAKAKFSAIHSLAHCRPFSVAPDFFFSCYHTGTPSHVDFDFWPACKKETRVQAVRKSYAFPLKQLNYRQTFAFLETTFSGVAPQLLWSKPLHLHTCT